jgi:hypothetical protein
MRDEFAGCVAALSRLSVASPTTPPSTATIRNIAAATAGAMTYSVAKAIHSGEVSTVER